MNIGIAELTFDDSTEDERLVEQVRTLFSATEGSFVCNRRFGIRPDIVDQPLQMAKAYYAADVHEKIEMFIPQLVVEDIGFRVEEDTLYPIVSLAQNEEYEADVSDSDTENEDVGEEDEYERDERF